MSALVVVVVLVAAACGDGSETTQTTTTTTPPAGGSDAAAVMGLALRELVTVDNTFGGGTPFAKLLVQERLDPTAGSAFGGPEPGRALTAEERAAIEDALAGISSMRWIGDPDEQITDDLQPAIPGAAIVGVGEPDISGTTALVPVSLWCGGLCGTWFTYRFVATDGVWAIDGIEGPVAVS